MSGWKDWAVGEVVEESDFQSFVQDQVVQVYDNSGARGSALGTAVAEGMVSYLKDTNLVEVYDGSGWQNFTGDITAVTAGTALTGGGTSGAVTLNVDLGAVTIPASQISDLTATASALNTIDDGTLGFTALSNGTAGVTYQPISPNYIINGAFDIWQRGTSFTGVTTAVYTADRFTFGRTSATGGIDLTRSTDAPKPFNFSAKIQRQSGTSSTTNIYFNQRLEDAGNYLAGQEAILSFWAKAGDDFSATSLRTNFRGTSATSAAATYSANNGFMNTGQPDFFSASEVAVTLTTSWQRFTRPITLPSTINGLQVAFLITPVGTAGADDSFYVTGVQLEAGSVATPFRRNANSIQGELAACQRYYQRIDALNQSTGIMAGTGYNIATTGGQYYFQYSEKRVVPSITASAAADFLIIHRSTTAAPTTIAFTRQGITAARFILGGSSGLTLGEGSQAAFVNNSTGFIEIIAEL